MGFDLGTLVIWSGHPYQAKPGIYVVIHKFTGDYYKVKALSSAFPDRVYLVRGSSISCFIESLFLKLND